MKRDDYKLIKWNSKKSWWLAHKITMHIITNPNLTHQQMIEAIKLGIDESINQDTVLDQDYSRLFLGPLNYDQKRSN